MEDDFQRGDPGISFNRPVPSTTTSDSSRTVDKSPQLAEIDRELEELLKKQQSKVKVFGVGGGGGNTISRMKEIGIKGGEFVAVNTDAQDLLYANADNKILIGKELTMGLGAGSNPKTGEEAAHESEQDIKKSLSGSDMVFITCGLGGGTGTGGAPVIAELAKKQGALTIGVVTLPFTIEGRKRIENAEYGLERMESIVDTLIVIPNDKLLEIAPELPLQTAFKVADEILTNAVKGVTELVTRSGLVNLDFADIKAVMLNGGVSLMGMGEADSANRAKEAVDKAITNPLLDVDISNATGALVNIVGGNDMSLDEAREIIATVGERLSSDAKLIWGAQISPEMEKSMRVMIIITGVKSAQIMGGELPSEIQKQLEMEDELGIEFLE
ncbi:cell division protein FtsZ [Candidatus Pacearchaeota archaeon]|nr:cell division protein FtsZ [Candidatus Pacearchaeota archaeon]MBD3282953.1 cell division protein FtsZ [Candidatus Pacearchaeota archaeon]